jgi:hypothetical protein
MPQDKTLPSDHHFGCSWPICQVLRFFQPAKLSWAAFVLMVAGKRMLFGSSLYRFGLIATCEFAGRWKFPGIFSSAFRHFSDKIHPVLTLR